MSRVSHSLELLTDLVHHGQHLRAELVERLRCAGVAQREEGADPTTRESRENKVEDGARDVDEDGTRDEEEDERAADGRTPEEKARVNGHTATANWLLALAAQFPAQPLPAAVTCGE